MLLNKLKYPDARIKGAGIQALVILFPLGGPG